MTNGLIFFGVLAAISMTVALLDLWARRKDRREHDRGHLRR